MHRITITKSRRKLPVEHSVPCTFRASRNSGSCHGHDAEARRWRSLSFFRSEKAKAQNVLLDLDLPNFQPSNQIAQQHTDGDEFRQARQVCDSEKSVEMEWMI